MRLKEKLICGLVLMLPILLLIIEIVLSWFDDPVRTVETLKMYGFGFLMVSGLTGGGPIVWGPILYFEERKKRQRANT